VHALTNVSDQYNSSHASLRARWQVTGGLQPRLVPMPRSFLLQSPKARHLKTISQN